MSERRRKRERRLLRDPRNSMEGVCGGGVVDGKAVRHKRYSGNTATEPYSWVVVGLRKFAKNLMDFDLIKWQ